MVGFRALVRSDVDRAVVGLICDPEFVVKASTAGIDGTGREVRDRWRYPADGRYRVNLLKDGFVITLAKCIAGHIQGDMP